MLGSLCDGHPWWVWRAVSVEKPTFQGGDMYAHVLGVFFFFLLLLLKSFKNASVYFFKKCVGHTTWLSSAIRD